LAPSLGGALYRGFAAELLLRLNYVEKNLDSTFKELLIDVQDDKI
jgi:hypothetical protein